MLARKGTEGNSHLTAFPDCAAYLARPLGERDGNSRVTCIDRMEFDADGFIKPIRITHEGVPARRLK